jgi:hypothetical protein
MVIAKGKLLDNGAPLKVDSKAGITVSFIEIPQDGMFSNSYPAANYKRDTGTFEVPGKEGRGIPLGKYRITVNIMAIPSTPAVEEINDRFSKKNTEVIREVKNDEPIVIDVSKPEG